MTHEDVDAPRVHTGICGCVCLPVCCSVFRGYLIVSDYNRENCALSMDSVPLDDICCDVSIEDLSALTSRLQLFETCFLS